MIDSIARSLLGAATVMTAAALSTPARADDNKKICSDAYSQAQTLRDEHKLKEARDQLRICSQSSCTEFIVKDCTAWLLETEGRVPSVVLSAKDSRGQPLVDVTVSLDGSVIAQKLDGQSIDVDPGAHTFTFVGGDGTRVSQTFTVLEGQKAQAVAAMAPLSSSPASVGTGATPNVRLEGTIAAASPGPSFWTTPRAIGVAAGGAGIAGIVLGSVFGALAQSAANAQNTDCASAANCSHHAQALSDHSNAAAESTVSTVAFIAGGALLAGGAALFFLKGHAAGAPAPAGLVWMPSVATCGGGMLLAGRF